MKVHNMLNPNPLNGTEEEKDTPEVLETPQDPAPNPEPERPEPPSQPPAPDYEKKFSESSRENQILQSQLRDKDARIEQLTKQNTPTDSELRESFPEWDQMLPHEQRAARKQLALERSNAALQHELAEIKARQAWDKDLKNAVKAYPGLKGREDDFEKFVMKPTHRTTPIEVLAKAFSADATPETPDPQTPRPGPQRGSGGPKTLEKGPKWTANQQLEIQRNDPKKYREMLLAGEFDD
jgi:hypothetical protein